MTKISDLHRRWSKDADYNDAYDALGEEFDLGRALIKARTAAGLSQAQLARRPYSIRRARAGSIDSARVIGPTAAATASATSPRTVPDSVSASSG